MLEHGELGKNWREIEEVCEALWGNAGRKKVDWIVVWKGTETLYSLLAIKVNSGRREILEFNLWLLPQGGFSLTWLPNQSASFSLKLVVL